MLRLRFDELLGERADLVAVSSAGVGALVGEPMDDTAAAELSRLGGDPAGFAATQLDPEAATAADLVLTVTRGLRSRVLEQAPRALKRTFTIRELAAVVDLEQVRGAASEGAPALVARAAASRGAARVEAYDLTDPFRQPQRVHRQVADIIDQDCAVIARALSVALVEGLDKLDHR
jgi:protein-tyrosine phosphatase